jgi:ribosomal protein S27AE
MATVKHPHWQCPRCGQVMFWFGATSHMNRCKVGEEPWRKALRKAVD